MILEQSLNEIKTYCETNGATLVAVSKTHPAEEIKAAYDLGLRDFGENRVQELVAKQPELPEDIRWHMIGHLQRNKVKYIAPFVHMIHSVDTLKLLTEINKEAAKQQRTIKCLLQVHIALEETKFGFDDQEVIAFFEQGLYKSFPHVTISGLMGMATFTDDMKQVRYEFRYLADLFARIQEHHFEKKDCFNVLSMGMSGDYRIAIEEGSTLVRVGSLIFGQRKTITKP